MVGIFQWAYALPNQPGLLRGDRIEGDPRWLSDELYDVVAKVGQADLADWQKPADEADNAPRDAAVDVGRTVQSSGALCE